MQIIKKIIVAILLLESRLIIRKYKPFIVAVTGSVGKTSTKDAIYEALKGQGRYARKSEKSMNSEIGLPLTVIGAPNAWRSMSGWMRNMSKGLDLILSRRDYPDCLVLELGADHPGDIRRVARWLPVDIAVITRVSKTPVHVEFFASPEAVFEEKASLAQAVKKGGALILFADDDKVMSIADRVKGREVRVMSFGTAPTATVRGSEGAIAYETAADGARVPTGMSFKLDLSGNSVPISIPGIIGAAYMYPLLAAAAAGLARGMSVSAIVEALARYEAPKGRLNIIPGMSGSTIIDDTYNSSPDAALAALDALRLVECSGAKIAVMGDMMELGAYSAEEHRRIGLEASGIARRLVTVGMRSRYAAEAALAAGMPADMVRSFGTSSEAADYLRSLVGPGDVVLVKGSQSVRAERIVAALMRDPAQAGELLVRQEREWLEKA